MVIFDPKKPLILLAASGWKDADGDGILDKNGKPLHFTMIYAAEDVLRKGICTT